MKYLKTYEYFYLKVNVDISLDEYEYQYRDIDTGVWYKRVKGDDTWSFISEEEFNKNITKKI